MTSNKQSSPILDDNSTTYIKDIFYLYLPYWKVFAASVLIFIVFAFAYLCVTTPIYTRTASIMIRDNSKKSGASISESEIFSNMGLFQSQSSIKDEMQVLKTNLLIREVIKRLGIDKSYTTKIYGLRSEDLYETSPVEVELDTLLADNNSLFFDINLAKNNSVNLDNFVYNDEKSDLTYHSNIGDTNYSIWNNQSSFDLIFKRWLS